MKFDEIVKRINALSFVNKTKENMHHTGTKFLPQKGSNKFSVMERGRLLRYNTY